MQVNTGWSLERLALLTQRIALAAGLAQEATSQLGRQLAGKAAWYAAEAEKKAQVRWLCASLPQLSASGSITHCCRCNLQTSHKFSVLSSASSVQAWQPICFCHVMSPCKGMHLLSPGVTASCHLLETWISSNAEPHSLMLLCMMSTMLLFFWVLRVQP